MGQYNAPERMMDAPLQLVMYTFGQDAVAASQTDVQLPRAIGEASQAVESSVAPWAGDVVGIGYTLSAAGTTGAFTIGPTINGTEDTDGQLTVGTTTEGYTAIARGLISVAAGDNIGVEITTAAGWDGTTSDLVVDVYVLYQMTGV